MVRDAWNKLGAVVTLSVLPASDLYQNIIKPRDYDALLFGEAVAKGSDLYAFWHSSQRNAPGLNIAEYTNSKADKILESLRTATSTADMQASYAKLRSMIATDDPAIFLYSPQFIYAMPKALQDVTIGTVTTPSDRFATIANWYMSTERVWNIFTHTKS
jgi:peptide/nickel transport system substrate-binding protein